MKEAIPPNETERSWASMESFIGEVASRSRLQRTVDGEVVRLETESGEKFEMAEIADRGEAENTKFAKEIREFLSNFFDEDENDVEGDYVAAIENKFGSFYVVRNDKQEIVSFLNSQLAVVEKSGGPPDASLVVWYVVTDEQCQDKGLATELYHSAYEGGLRDMKAQGARFLSVAGETNPTVETYLNRMGRKRVYYETADGLSEVEYLSPPSTADDDPVAEHFMARFFDDRTEVGTEEFLRVIRSIYDLYLKPEYFEDDSESFKKKYFKKVEDTYRTLADTLGDAKGGKLYLLSAEERAGKQEELRKKGKSITELETEDA
jgi:ribosomal protein S18 acetylase RimI-like enzyme